MTLGKMLSPQIFAARGCLEECISYLTLLDLREVLEIEG